MLEWLKDKVAAGMQGISNARAGAELLTQFSPLEKIQGVTPGISERLTRFILTGERSNAVAELGALKGAGHVLGMSAVYFGGMTRGMVAKSLATLVKVLPEDPELYLRLALVYDAVMQSSRASIPAFSGSLQWLSTFLIELSKAEEKTDAFFPVSLVCSMIVARGEAPNILVRGAFIYEDSQGKSQINSYWMNRPYAYFLCLKGFPELVLRFPEIVRAGFQQKDAACRASVLQALAVLEIPTSLFVEEIASQSVAGSKAVREQAERLISPHFEAFRGALENRAERGSSDERYHAVRLLRRVGGHLAHSFLTGRLEKEKSAKVTEAIRESLSSDQKDQAGQQDGVVEDFGIRPLPEVPVRAPLGKEVLADLRICIDEFERRSAEDFSRNKNAHQQNIKRTPVSAGTADKLFDALQDFVVKKGQTWRFIDIIYWGTAGPRQMLGRFGANPGLQLIHLVRWCLLITGHSAQQEQGGMRVWSVYYAREAISAYQKVRNEPIDLRELAAVFRAIGLDDRVIGEDLLRENTYASSPFWRSDPNTIWPYFAERLDLLEEALGLNQSVDQRSPINSRYPDTRLNAFGILKLFPRNPARFVPLLWDLALGSGKTDRPFAQECLEKTPNKEEKIVAALASRQQDARLAAAEWLGRLKYHEAIPQLRAALAKEKSEVIKDELMRSLEALGVGLEELLDRDKLGQEAAQGIKKDIPKDLEWFPLTDLPIVRWADSGEPVSQTILRWFVVQACRLKNPEAGPTLRRYCSLFRGDDREKLGRFVLEIWIAKDTKPKYAADQAAALAQQEARQAAASAKQYPQYYPDFDEQRYYQAAFNRLLVLPEGSQNSTKGILAVAGACCGADAVSIVHQYIKQWYGYRGAQAKALLQVLAWVDHPSATQVVLAVANRFRTKGIQEEALRQCNLLAQRKGWTLDELADRTIPTAGFDEDGLTELDYGARKFRVRLSEEMAIGVTNQAGKTISSLPDANQSDDAEKVKEAKAALSASRKELKTVLAMQKDRLYEGLCTQRTWRFEDWATYLHKHPIVGRYCQRLVWVACDGEKATTSFRPLADGTLTNHQDEEVSLTNEAMIRLAHDHTLAQEDRIAWIQHFSDYKVEPLFQQFGKPTIALEEGMKQAGEITDFMGHVTQAFSLRNRLTRLGYTRGAAQDAGWFFDYHKSFLGLGIEAVIEFTGNPLPEVNRTVALQRLTFVRKGSEDRSEALTLGELPPVLLSECWNDIRLAAADGPGFAADWEKQTEF